jgi:serine protease AprX
MKIDVGLKDNSITEEFNSFSYPNPFTNATAISYEVAATSPINIDIYDIYGKKVSSILKQSNQSQGNHIVYWNGTNENGDEVKQGCYFYKISDGSKTAQGKLVKL